MPRASARLLAAGAAVALALLLAFAAGRGARAADAPADIVVCPDCPVTSLAAAVADAAPGARIEVRGGTYPGGLVVDRPLELVGVGNPVIDGGGKGTLLRAAKADLAISGFTLRNTGTNPEKEDAAIDVDGGRATIVGNVVEDALFGIYLKQAAGSVVRDNVVHGKALDVARRGDGVKIWYSDGVVVEGNQASDGRDIILWYSNGATVSDNVFDRGRYGLHLMYSDGAKIERNSLRANSIGLYVMYSRDPVIVGNTLADNHGASGGGLGFKDVDRALVEANRFVNNHIAVQVDTSPREPGAENVFRGNVFAFNAVGFAFSPSIRDNTLVDNNFIDNGEQVAILGRGQLRDITWAADGRGNYWSDYAGFDADHDGIGDIPYRSQRLFEVMVDRHPALRLFAYSPASLAVDFAAKAMPVARPETKLEDPAPLMTTSRDPLLPPAAEPGGSRTALGLAGLAVAAGAAGAALALRRPVAWAFPPQPAAPQRAEGAQ